MTLGNPKLTDYILAEVLTNIIRGDRTPEFVIQTAILIDKYLDERFMSKSEGLQETIVKEVLLPLCKEMLKEQPQVYKGILFEKWKEISVIPISK